MTSTKGICLYENLIPWLTPFPPKKIYEDEIFDRQDNSKRIQENSKITNVSETCLGLGTLEAKLIVKQSAIRTKSFLLRFGSFYIDVFYCLRANQCLRIWHNSLSSWTSGARKEVGVCEAPPPPPNVLKSGFSDSFKSNEKLLQGGWDLLADCAA